MKKSDINKKRILYFKAGNVVREFSESASTPEKITGGPNYYVYSTMTKLTDKSQILYISFSENALLLYNSKCYARTIKKKIIGTHILKFLYYLLIFRPHHIICVKRRWLHLVYILSRIIGATFTISVHTDIIERRKIDMIITKHLIKIADSVICHGPFLKLELDKISNKKNKIIEYNASCEDIIRMKSPLSVDINKYKNQKIIAYIGRMEKSKGVYDLYEAAKKLFANHKEVVVFFAGGGNAVANILSNASSERLDKKIVVLNRISRPQVATILKYAWIVVTPTKRYFPEGRCMAAMEALSIGVPVIGPDFGPFPFLIKNGHNGFLFEPDSVDDLHKKIDRALNPKIYEELKHNAIQEAVAFQRTNLSYGDAAERAIYCSSQ